MKKPDYPAGNEIVLQWEFIGNNVSENYFSSVFTLENRSEHTLGNSGWAIYYNQMGQGVLQESVTGNVRIDHINGDLVKISPLEDFELEPGQSVEISFHKSGRLVKKNESPLGPYMVYTDAGGNELAPVAIEHYKIKPFPPLDVIYPLETSIPLPDAGWVYEQNRHQLLLRPEKRRIIPTPVKESYSGKAITLKEGLMIHYGEGLSREAGYLAKMLEEVMGTAPSVMQSSVGGPNIIQLLTDKAKVTGDEAYQMIGNGENGVMVTGRNSAGVFYGIQSLLSLLPVNVWANPEPQIELESFLINDGPAFEYRGMHLDIARNFLEPAAIRKLIEVMAFYKMNKLHLHLSDDEGWRLEIPSLPELTDIGGYRGHTSDNRDHINPNYGSGPLPEPGVGHGSGFLSRETFIEILRFADEHHIEVIPEINFPGHARAAIYAMEVRYDRLMKEGKEEDALQYRLIDPEDASLYISAQNFDDNVICVCHEAPYLFYETVVEEVIMMYEEAGLTLKVLHAGGDEVPHGSWTGSPICKEFLESHPEIGGAENLQAYFEGRLLEILKKKSLVMAGWEEIAMKKSDEGKWIPNPEFADDDMLPYVWNSQGEYLDLGNRLANAGYPIILCNVTNFYFDLAYNHHPEEPGHYWGGYVNTRRAFELIPFDVFKSTLTDRYWKAIDPAEAFKGLERLKPEARENIIGIQGQLWSEFVKGGEMMEYFYMPKLIGLAERAWAGQRAWGSIESIEKRIEAMNSAWNEFANLVGQREMPRLDYLFGGFNYRLPPPGALIKDGQLFANIDFPGLTIRYTTDGSEPDTDSPVYSGPVELSGKATLRSFDTRGRGSRVTVVD
ncbi:MAG: family 20 glycosylhydrolase [Bacteroidota bacterium]